MLVAVERGLELCAVVGLDQLDREGHSLQDVVEELDAVFWSRRG